MWKIMRHGMSILFILLAVFAGWLWARSYERINTITFHTSDYWDEGWCISSGIGVVMIAGDDFGWPRHAPHIQFVSTFMGGDDAVMRPWVLAIGNEKSSFVGIRTASTHWGFQAVLIPMWLIVTLLLIVPAGDGLFLLRKRWAIKDTLCPKCHYDLRASAATCPECGTPIDRPIDKLPA